MALNATAAALIGLLRRGPATGYALAQRAQDELGDYWTVTRSQVYRELSAMAVAGLVEPGPTGAREARPYAVTSAGLEAFTTWLHTDLGPDVVRIPLLLRMAFVDALDPTRLAELVAEQRAEHAARLASYEELESAGRALGGSDRDLVTLRFGLAYERAVLAWFDELDLPQLSGG
jgi:DNA-binding PadR family transcriptional regulator